MNKIKVKISQIDNIKNLNIVDFDFEEIKLKMMSLDLNEKIKLGQKVLLTVKPTNVSMAKDFTGTLSYSNQIKAKIEKIEKGKLLTVVNSKIKQTAMQSIFTTSSFQKMNLKIDDEVTLLFKASDLSILEVLDG